MSTIIEEITKVPTNTQVIKILNEIIKRYNSLANVYTFKGSVETYNDLLAIQNPNVGDVYNVKQEDAEHGVAAGSNFVWDGTAWDNLGMSLDGLVRKINGFTPDDLGAVIFQYIKNIEDKDGTLTVTVRDGEDETQLTIQTGKVKTVNGFVPNDLGAVIFQYIKNITDNDGTLTITVRNGEEESTLTIDTGKVKTVNGIEPDAQGNIQLENSNAIPVGTILALLDDEVPEGYLPAEGAEISRTTYADLFNVIGTKFGEGDGSTTFSLPNLVGRFLEGDGTPGTLKEPGLPNITGHLNDVLGSIKFSIDGAFYDSHSARCNSYDGGDVTAVYWYGGFNASLSNAIYGKSSVVQPASITVKFCIKY